MIGIIYPIWSLLIYDIPRFLKNVWKFRKALKNHYSFDSHGMLLFLQIGLNDIANYVQKHGYEVEVSRNKKIEKMQRAVQILSNINNDTYLELAEKEIGEEFKWSPMLSSPQDNEIQSTIIQKSHEIEEKEWEELMQIIKGQDYSKFDKTVDFEKQFDGSGLRGWWD
jgi:hypothetical protein